MIQPLILVCTTIGFLCLCAAMPRHHAAMVKRKLSAVEARTIRISGWIGIVAALLLSMGLFGAAYGALVWIGHLTAGAALTVAFLTVRNRPSAR
jgi:hypothetical protein